MMNHPRFCVERLVIFDPHVYKVHPAVTLSLEEGMPLCAACESVALDVRLVLGQRLADDE